MEVEQVMNQVVEPMVMTDQIQFFHLSLLQVEAAAVYKEITPVVLAVPVEAAELEVVQQVLEIIHLLVLLKETPVVEVMDLLVLLLIKEAAEVVLAVLVKLQQMEAVVVAVRLLL